ncbi:MAG: LLM class F420-dependent oxidoreductase [Acidimicrobiales bacterium]|nr:MAG: LLM class F420-dependent oxidoreductase [Acidimicrobiales bacterium]
MSESTGSRIGISFAGFQSLGMDTGLWAARLAEELGFGSFWTPETTGPEAFVTLTAVGSVAPSLDLGTGVVPIQLRSPALLAMAAATLQALHPEREVLVGVGVSSPVVTERWHGVPYGDGAPVQRMREFVEVLRRCLSGETVTFEGRFYAVRRFRLGVRLSDRVPRIVLAALNPAMLRLAGEIADGVLLNYVPASHVPWCVERVREGGDATVYAYVHLGVCDRDAARPNARRDIFSYAVVDAYAESFSRAGFATAVRQIRERHAAGDRDGAIAAVPDEMVDSIDIVGDDATVARALADYRHAGVEVPVVMPLPWGDDRRKVIEKTLRAVAPH